MDQRNMINSLLMEEIKLKQSSPCDNVVANSLSCMPKKSLTRFRCVSKDWGHLISDTSGVRPLVAASFLSLSKAPHSFDVQGTYLEEEETGHLSPNASISFTLKGNWLIYDSCCGLILCCHRPSSNPNVKHYYVGNPATAQWLAIPTPPQENASSQYALAFDGRHIKVVQIAHCIVKGGCLDVAIYSSDRGEWRELKVAILRAKPSCPNVSRVYCHHPIFAMGIVHWITFNFFLYYDLNEKYCKIIMLPKCPESYPRCLAQSQGQIHYCHSDHDGIHIWEFVEECSWPKWLPKHRIATGTVKLQYPKIFCHVVKLTSMRWYPQFFEFCAFSEDPEVVYLTLPGKLVSYNVRTYVMKELCNYTHKISTSHKIFRCLRDGRTDLPCFRNKKLVNLPTKGLTAEQETIMFKYPYKHGDATNLENGGEDTQKATPAT